MIVPFAEARNHEQVQHVTFDEVVRIAEQGGVEGLLRGDVEVGVHLGSAQTRGNKRCWVEKRFGYPAAVFSDAKRLAAANAMNVHLTLKSALERGFDLYDLGVSVARPDGGLLQFKHRRSAVLEPTGAWSRQWARIPRAIAPAFLSRAPLFSLARGALWLNVGLAANTSDAQCIEAMKRWRFRGLTGVRLFAERAPSSELLEQVRGLYRGYGHERLRTLEVVDSGSAPARRSSVLPFDADSITTGSQRGKPTGASART
jgi:hypothetical protein